MKQLDLLLAEKLLSISAVKLQPEMPFTSSLGWYSPIYVDNRKTLSYPAIRNFVKVELARLIAENFAGVQVVAGVATGGIAQGVLVADALGLPFVYVRETPKDHGLENQIEGNIKPGQKVVIVEDLVTTGRNCMNTAQAVQMAGGKVTGAVAMFTYEFPMADEAFKRAGLPLLTVTNYSALIKASIATGLIKESDLPSLQAWREDPEHWTPSLTLD